MYTKKLPIGIQTFENLISEGHYYVDKTHYIFDLKNHGKYYFLSRPRRFGKSLFLSTIKSAYESKKDIFNGLYIYNNWSWGNPHPVIHISFGSGVDRNIKELRQSFFYILKEHSKLYNISYSYDDLKSMFAELIHSLYKKYERKVVVLVDEYDKPILDNIEHRYTAEEIRDELKNYYSVIKDSDPYIEFVFITGVSKFSKVSLFSGLNNLKDITIDKRYSSLCGYTHEELQHVFADRLHDVDLDQVRMWYNGYSWLGEQVYNPFDILLYLDSKEFASYWFETGTPTFLIKLLHEKRYPIPSLENIHASEKLLGSFDVDRIEVETLLFQTGYLTINSVEKIAGTRRFSLCYPNLEVKQSLTDSLLTHFTGELAASEKAKFSAYEALEANNLDSLKDIFQAFFASIPHDWYRKNQIAQYEGYYASIVYCYFAALGLDVHPEEPTNMGRMDLVIRFQGRVYVLEFKVVELTDTAPALGQIKAKGYSQKFAEKEVYLIGVEFSSQERNVVGFAWEKADS
jgi:hypothetical protein